MFSSIILFFSTDDQDISSKLYAELGSIADTVSIKANNHYRRYICICICIFYNNYKSISNHLLVINSIYDMF